MDLIDITYLSIKEHAEMHFPEECCGLILTDGTVLRLKNTSDTPAKSFTFDPVVLVKYQGRIDYIYHSHVNRSPTPSDADKRSCEAIGIPFLIISVPTGETSSYSPARVDRQMIGRSFVYGVSDCFSIVSDYYRQEMGITLPDVVRPYFGWWLDGQTRIIENTYKDLGFEEVTVLEKGDVILMMAGGVTTIDHMAVYLGDQQILHHTLMGLSRISPYGGYWVMTTKKFLRHESRR